MNFLYVENLSETQIKELYEDIIENDTNNFISECYVKCNCRDGKYGYSTHNLWSRQTSGIVKYNYHFECGERYLDLPVGPCRTQSNYYSIQFIYCP